MAIANSISPSGEEPERAEGKQPSEESTRILALRDEIEKNQLSFLDESAKRIVDLVTVFLGVLFSIAAFGEKFPPAYLSANSVNKFLSIAALASYALALGFCLVAQMPRSLLRYENNVTQQKAEIDHMIQSKLSWYRIGSILFGLASFALTLLIINMILLAVAAPSPPPNP